MSDGGPAFPVSYIGNDEPHEGIGGGLSIRDYFAAAALTGICAALGQEESDGSTKMPRVKSRFVFHGAATDAYEIADAMLKQRESTT